MNTEKFYKRINQNIPLQYEIISTKKHVFGVFDKFKKLELIFSNNEKTGSMVDLAKYDNIKQCRLHVKKLECQLPIGYLSEDVWKFGTPGKTMVKGTLVLEQNGWWKDKFGNKFLDRLITKKENLK